MCSTTVPKHQLAFPALLCRAALAAEKAAADKLKGEGADKQSALDKVREPGTSIKHDVAHSACFAWSWHHQLVVVA